MNKLKKKEQSELILNFIFRIIDFIHIFIRIVFIRISRFT